MSGYPSEDYRKYLYATADVRTHRVIEEMDRLEDVLDQEFADFLFKALEDVENCLNLMVFEDHGAIVERKIPSRLCVVATNELRYSDGRDVATTFFLEDHSSFTWVWHPDPAHPSNQPGHVAKVEKIHGVTTRKFVVAMPGVIDMTQE